MIARINGVALSTAEETLAAEELRQRACTELLRQAAQCAGLLDAADVPTPDGVISVRRLTMIFVAAARYWTARGFTTSLVSSSRRRWSTAGLNSTETFSAAALSPLSPPKNCVPAGSAAGAGGAAPGAPSCRGGSTATNLACTRLWRICSVASSSGLPARRQISLP